MNISYFKEVGLETSIIALLFYIVIKLITRRKIKSIVEIWNEKKFIFPKERNVNESDYSAIRSEAVRSSKYQYLNTGVERARIVINSIFATASNICLFEINLDGDIFSETFLYSLEAFLKRGGKLNILLEECLDETKQAALISILDKYSSATKGQLKVFITNKDVVKENKINSETNHFIVGDKKMYRFETNMAEHRSVNDFNDPNSSLGLNRLFLKYSKESINYFGLKSNPNFEAVEDIQLKLFLDASVQGEIYEKSALIRNEINKRIKQRRWSIKSQG